MNSLTVHGPPLDGFFLAVGSGSVAVWTRVTGVSAQNKAVCVKTVKLSTLTARDLSIKTV